MFSFQCPATDYAQSLIIMHNYLMTFLFGIGIFVAFIMGYLVLKCMFIDPYDYDEYSIKEINSNSLYNSMANQRNNFISNYLIKNYSDYMLVAFYFFDFTSKKYLKKNLGFIKRFLTVLLADIPAKANDYDDSVDMVVFTDYHYNYNQKYYNYNNELDYDFVNSFFLANNYYKQQYYNIENLNNSFFSNLFAHNKYVISTNIMNGLVMEPFFNNNFNSFLTWENVRHSTKLEIVWTLIPTFILFFVAVPSFSLLYGYDEPLDMPVLTLKVVGHQWYWSYEYSDYSRNAQLGQSIAFDSYMVHESDFTTNLEYRLLETDMRVVLPVGATIRVLITSGDVLHSWAVPSLGTKTDAIPGRLNQALLLLTRPGTFFGQCSELCGVQHGFMPIVVEGVKIKDYFAFLGLFYSWE